MMSKPASVRARRLVVGSSRGSRPGSDDAAPPPEVRVQQHRHVHAADRPDQAVDTRGVIEVAVAAYDGLDRGRVDVQAAHVLRDAVRAGARVEQEPVLTAGLGHRDQHRESVLGDQRVGNMPVRHQRRRPPRAAPRVRPPGRSLVGHQAVGGVIHQGDHDDRIHRLQVDLDGRLDVMP